MKLTLLSHKEFVSIILPEKCVGCQWVYGKNYEDRRQNVVLVEAVHGATPDSEPVWQIKSNRRFTIIGQDGQAVLNAIIEPLKLYRIESKDKSQKYILYVEPLSNDRKQYSVYEITGQQAKLRIGRHENNDIVYECSYISREHAELIFQQEKVMVRDLDSANHTYVNGKAIKQALLKNGDMLYFMGLQITIIGKYIFLNHPDGKVTVHSNTLKAFHALCAPALEEQEPEEDEEEIPEEFYYRAPRLKTDVDMLELKLDAPPADQSKDDMPMIMVVGPSVTMGLASAATGLYSVVTAVSRGDITSAIPSIIMSLSMLLGTLMWPLMSRTYQRKKRIEKEALRQTAYHQYLKEMEQVVSNEIADQEKLLKNNAVPVEVYAERVLDANPQIWERTKKHSDFLSLRLGYGDIPPKINIQHQERRFMMEKDNLTEAMYQFVEQKRWLHGVPICLPIVSRRVCGFYAQREQLLSFAKSLILQIAALHGYDEVKLALVFDERDADEISFVRWLPHTMNNERTVRYIATNSEEAKELSYALDLIIEHRKGMTDYDLGKEKPYFVLICMDKMLTEKTECVRRILDHEKNLNFSVISLSERLQDLPKECSAVVELDGPVGRMTLINDVSEPAVEFHADILGQIDTQSVVRALANTQIDVSDSVFSLPTKYTFFEMLDIGMIEHLNLLERWSSNDPTKSLAAPVGIDRYGELFKLDLHERAHGPHGLVAGMTGSGKSEFLIAYILSMAVNFHPEEVAFILIDYKGGGMAKAFESLPHTAGVITNLDGNGIKRSLASMRSELHRRERIFRDTSLQHNVSNIDIYKYQRLYRDGKVGEPLPHLLIISDEFAELKKEQPDFMSELASTARVGRSLGVHLILATQKPGGVVDDQVRSNSRFRICLKVQDNGDSMEMLGRSEAAELMETGRFYLQVGNNELFEVGQSAWAGAPYYASNHVLKNRDDAVSIINMSGRTIAEANIDRFTSVKDPPKQLDVVTQYIRRISQEEGIVQWKMWLDPIPKTIYVDSLSDKYSRARNDSRPFVLEPIVGEYDDPAHQVQGLLTVPLSRDGNVIVYGSTGSGKEMFLEAICYSLIKTHSPDEVNIYILDFGAETLDAFSRAPHVGDVIRSYETEKVHNLFKLVQGKLETRKALFSHTGGNIQQYNAEASEAEPNMVVIINNYAAFSELFDDYAGEINYLSREGTKYGIYFVLTCSGINNVKYNLRQNFSSLYCLQLNSIDDYSSIVGKTDGLYPEKYKGRGLVWLDKDNLFEFQTASVAQEDPPYKFIRAFAEKAAEKYPTARAARVPVLPERVTEQFILPGIRKGDLAHVPVGVARNTLEFAYFDFTRCPVSLALSVSQEWQNFTDALGELIAGRCGVKTMVFAPAGKTAIRSSNENLRVFKDVKSSVAAARELFEAVLNRNNEYKDALAAEKPTPEFEPIFVVIQSMSLLKTMLNRYKPAEGEKQEASDDTPLNRLQLAMEKCVSAYHVYFLVAESLNSLTPFTVEEWYKTHITGNEGLWIGSGFNTQFRLSANKKPQGAAANLDSNFGFVVNNAEATLVKFLQ